MPKERKEDNDAQYRICYTVLVFTLSIMPLRILYLGRFQPLHRGHWRVMKQVQRRGELVIGIGSSEASQDDPRNPYNFAQRKQMIEAVFTAHGRALPQIVAVPDIPNDDEYVAHVLSLTGPIDLVVSGEVDETRKLFVRAGIPAWYVGRHGGISASEVRRRMNAGEHWEELVPRAVRGVITGE
jgi:nicotinamide-nucleotide adenylyltransferase